MCENGGINASTEDVPAYLRSSLRSSLRAIFDPIAECGKFSGIINVIPIYESREEKDLTNYTP